MNIVNCVSTCGIPKIIEAFNRHLPLWRALPGTLVTTSPVDLPMETTIPTIRAGQRGHDGIVAAKRALEQFKALLDMAADWYCYFEYDSFCLEPQIPSFVFEKKGIWASETPNYDPNYETQIYGALPWVLDRETLSRIVDATMKADMTREHSIQDRLMYCLIYENNIPHHWYGVTGFSSGYCCREESGMYSKAIQSGAVLIHGVKDEWGYNFVMEERKKYIYQRER